MNQHQRKNNASVDLKSDNSVKTSQFASTAQNISKIPCNAKKTPQNNQSQNPSLIDTISVEKTPEANSIVASILPQTQGNKNSKFSKRNPQKKRSKIQNDDFEVLQTNQINSDVVQDSKTNENSIIQQKSPKNKKNLPLVPIPVLSSHNSNSNSNTSKNPRKINQNTHCNNPTQNDNKKKQNSHSAKFIDDEYGSSEEDYDNREKQNKKAAPVNHNKNQAKQTHQNSGQQTQKNQKNQEEDHNNSYYSNKRKPLQNQGLVSQNRFESLADSYTN